MDDFLDQEQPMKGNTTSDKLDIKSDKLDIKSDKLDIKSTNSTSLSVEGNQALQTAQLLQSSNLFPSAGGVAGVFTIIQFGREIGLSPVVALNNIAIISGKLAMSGASMLALSFKYGVRAEYVEETDERCTIKFTRDGYPTYTSIFTLEDAQKAGLDTRTDVWSKYPRTMLKWRAVSQGMKMIAPDILAGVYTEEEIRSIDNKDAQNHTPLLDVEPQKDAQNHTPSTDDVTKQDVKEFVDTNETDNSKFVDATPIDVVKKQEPSQDKASQAQIKKFHVMSSQSGLLHFMKPLKKWLAGIEGSGLTGEHLSGKDLNKDFCSKLIGEFEKFSCLFFASPSNREGIKCAFGGLKVEDKRKTLLTISSYVSDLSSFKNVSIDGATEQTLDDYLALFLVGLENQEHNKIADKVGDKGMTVDQVISTLTELGFEPELRERVSMCSDKQKTNNDFNF